MTTKEEDRIAQDSFHLKLLASAIDVLEQNRSALTDSQQGMLESMQNLQQLRIMPTVKQWNYLNSIKNELLYG